MDEMKLDPNSKIYNNTLNSSSASTPTRPAAFNTESSISPMEAETSSSLIASLFNLFASQKASYHGCPLIDWDVSTTLVIRAKKEDYEGFLQGVVVDFLNHPKEFFLRAARAHAQCGKYLPDSEELKIAKFFQSIGQKLGETGQLDEALVEDLFSESDMTREIAIWQTIQIINFDLSSDEHKEKIKAAQAEYQRARAEDVD